MCEHAILTSMLIDRSIEVPAKFSIRQPDAVPSRMADFTAACEFAGSDADDMEDDHGGRASPLPRPPTARQQLDFGTSTDTGAAGTRKRRVSTSRLTACVYNLTDCPR